MIPSQETLRPSSSQLLQQQQQQQQSRLDPNDGERGLQARANMSGKKLIEGERLMPPKPPHVEPLIDFTATMEELAILGRIQPHGFLIAVDEGKYPHLDTKTALPTPLLQSAHMLNARAIDNVMGSMTMYDPDISQDEGETPESSQSSSDSSTYQYAIRRENSDGTTHFSPGVTMGQYVSDASINEMPLSPTIASAAAASASSSTTAGTHQAANESTYPMRVISWNLQHLVAEPSSALINSPLGVLLGFEQLSRLRQDLSLCNALSDLNPWSCTLMVRREVVAVSTAVQDVLRDRETDRVRIDKLARDTALRTRRTSPQLVSIQTPIIATSSSSSSSIQPSPLLPDIQTSSNSTNSMSEAEHLANVSHTQQELAFIQPTHSNLVDNLAQAQVGVADLAQVAPSDATRIPIASTSPLSVTQPNTTSADVISSSSGHPTPTFTTRPLDRIMDQPAIGSVHLAASSAPSHSSGGVVLPFPPIPEPIIPTYTGQLFPQRFDVIFHRSGGLLVMEFEPAPPQEPKSRTKANFRRQALRAINTLQRAHSYEDLLARCAAEVRQVTGFDRTMVYRFHPDGSGEVVAESRTSAFELDSFLGLFYPANDIPAPARALYVRNKFRLIGDVAFRGVQLIPQQNPMTGAPFDLTNSLLRSVHPIHLQYLRNMGVRSSMSISIVIDGELWGLIACHHYRSSRYVDHETRLVAEQVGDLMAAQIPHQLQRQHIAQMSILRADLNHLSIALTDSTQSNHWSEALIDQQLTIMRMLSVTGFSIHSNGQVSVAGVTPTPDMLVRLAAFVLMSGTPTRIFTSSHLAKIFPAASGFTEIASGMMALILSAKDGEVMLFFRPELKSTVKYGGKPTDGRGEEHLTPRNSFAIWTQSMHGQSVEWGKSTLEIAQEFARLMIDVKLIFNYHEEQQQERARLMLSEEIRRKQIDFIDKICHEIRNPINGIMGSLILARDEIRHMEMLLQTTGTPILPIQESTPLTMSRTLMQYPTVGTASSTTTPNSQMLAMPSTSIASLQLGISSRLIEHLREVVTNLSNIEACASHQKVIADDVLGLSKLEQNKIALDRAPFNLPECIQQALAMFDASLRLKNLTFISEIDVLPQYAYVKGDPFRLRQIIANILSNAIKFTETTSTNPGIITITLRVSDDPVLEDSEWDEAEASGTGSSQSHKSDTDDRTSSSEDRHGNSDGGVSDRSRDTDGKDQPVTASTTVTSGPNIQLAAAANSNRSAQSSESMTIPESSVATSMPHSPSPATSTDSPSNLMAPVEYILTIQDNGIGISEQSLVNLFRPYQQATAHVSVKYEGSGLGLCIARELARLMGGDITLTSTLGVGTAARITFQALPLSASAVADFRAKQAVSEEVDEMMSSVRELTMAHSTSKSESAPSTPAGVQTSPIATTASSGIVDTGQRKTVPPIFGPAGPSAFVPSASTSATSAVWHPRVLLMEDNAINMKVLRRILETLGCVCTSAFNGVEGVQAFEGVFVPPYTDAYDIVATDLEMPLMNGLEAIRAIRGMEHQARYPSSIKSSRKGSRKPLTALINAAASSSITPDQPSSASNSETNISSSDESELSRSSHSAASSISNASTSSTLQTQGLSSNDLASLPAPCYLVCISGNVRTEFVDAAKQAGADEYLGKPFMKPALKAAIAQARKKQNQYFAQH